MRSLLFEAQPLPAAVDAQLRRRLSAAHRDEPFSTVDPRSTAHRVVGIANAVGLAATLCRGGVDLQGIEVDHLWLDIDGRVVDAAFPLYREDFVSLLRQFVAGDVAPDALESSAAGAGVDQRVVGLFPAPIRYIGAPVWKRR